MKATHAFAVAALFAAVSLLTACSDGRMPTAGAPHPTDTGWTLPEATAAGGQFHGTSLEVFNCSNCHDVNTFCFRCHFGPTGAKSPTPDWTHVTFALDPVEAIQHTDPQYQQFGETCATCHHLHNVALGHNLNEACANVVCHVGQ